MRSPGKRGFNAHSADGTRCGLVAYSPNAGSTSCLPRLLSPHSPDRGALPILRRPVRGFFCVEPPARTATRGLSRAGLLRFAALATAGIGGSAALATMVDCSDSPRNVPFYGGACPTVDYARGRLGWFRRYCRLGWFRRYCRLGWCGPGTRCSARRRGRHLRGGRRRDTRRDLQRRLQWWRFLWWVSNEGHFLAQ